MSDKSQMRMILIWRADFITPIPEPMFHVEHRARKKKSRKPLISLKILARGRQCESEVELRWCRPRHCTKPSGVCQVFFSHSVKLVLEGQVSAHSKAFTCINPATIIKVIALITRRRSAKSKNDAKWWAAPIIANLHGVCQVFFNFCTI